MTMIMKLWYGLRRYASRSGKAYENVIQSIIRIPTSTPVSAAGFLARREIKPSRNSPSIPPANTPESFHQVSNTLSTPIIARATPVPSAPQASVARWSTCIDSRWEALGRK